MVLDSAHKLADGDRIAVEPFRLSTDTRNQPSLFEVIFFHETTEYRYGFAATTEQIVREWLYRKPSDKHRESRIFEREAGELTLARGVFKEGQRIFRITSHKALFLSVLARFNNPLAEHIWTWFQRQVRFISGLYDYTKPFSIECLAEDHSLRQDVLSLIRRLDLAIHNIQIETRPVDVREMFQKLPKELRSTVFSSIDDQEWHAVEVRTFHRVFDATGNLVEFEAFDLEEHESDGTQKLLALAGPIVDTLKNGYVLVIDEFDARLHPLMTRALLQLFNDPSSNPHHAQLIFTTHNTNLLDHDLLRRDQIWFTEKNDEQATLLFALAEFKIRNDDPYERDYLSGGYGAVPYIGPMPELHKEEHVPS